MEGLPALPSPAGDTGRISPVSDVTSTTSGSFRSSSSFRSARYEAHIDFLAEELRNVREAWYAERAHYRATDLELERTTKLLEACDASYRCVVHAQGDKSHVPLSTVAMRAMEQWARDQHEEQLRALDEHIKERSGKFKQKCHDFINTNRLFSDAARAYFNEVEKFSTWTMAQACKLQVDYQKYCAITKEQGLEPKLLYDEDNGLDKMQDAFYDAWDERERALHRAMEIAHLDGKPDLLAGLFTH